MALRTPGYRLLERAALAYRRADAGLRRVDRASRAFASALLDRALSTEEKSRLSFRLYDEDLGLAEDPGELFEWERRWFSRELPPPPARILVGGAGAGREVRGLVGLGYAVDALEPAPAAAALCRRHLGDDGEVVVGSYDDLCRGETPFNSRRYDAILLGWGSLTHVLSIEGQARVLETSASLSPYGPILATFWMRAEKRPTGRAHLVGDAIGSMIGRIRGRREDVVAHVFVPWGGFNAPLTVREVQELAEGVGRRLRWDRESGGFPRATLLPSDA